MADERVTSLLPLQPTTFHILLSLTDEDSAWLRDHPRSCAAHPGRTEAERRHTVPIYSTGCSNPGLITETRNRPAPEMDDERRRYYRITPLGKAVAEAEAGRLRDLLKMARLCGVAPRTNLMNFYRLLLHLYPSSFRAEYGDEMSAIFALKLDRRSGMAGGCRALAFCSRRDRVQRGHGALGNCPAGPVSFRTLAAWLPWLHA